MKTEVRKEHGYWIVFVDDNPQFSFMYLEEAEKVRNLVEALLQANDYIIETAPDEIYPVRLLDTLEKSLKDIGAI